jgi:hypothetical protein
MEERTMFGTLQSQLQSSTSIKNTLQNDIRRLENLQERYKSNPEIISNAIFCRERDLLLENILRTLPEEVGAFKFLEGRAIRNRYKTVWSINNLKIHIQFL